MTGEAAGEERETTDGGEARATAGRGLPGVPGKQRCESGLPRGPGDAGRPRRTGRRNRRRAPGRCGRARRPRWEPATGSVPTGSRAPTSRCGRAARRRWSCASSTERATPPSRPGCRSPKPWPATVYPQWQFLHERRREVVHGVRGEGRGRGAGEHGRERRARVVPEPLRRGARHAQVLPTLWTTTKSPMTKGNRSHERPRRRRGATLPVASPYRAGRRRRRRRRSRARPARARPRSSRRTPVRGRRRRPRK